MKDFQTRKTLLRGESTKDLYPIPALQNKTSASTALLVSTPTLWYKRLGHINNAILSSVFSSNSDLCNAKSIPSFCEPCHLAKNNKLPFYKSQSLVTVPFDIVYSDVWTSSVPCISGIRYYVFLDHFTHFLLDLWLKTSSQGVKLQVFSIHIHT